MVKLKDIIGYYYIYYMNIYCKKYQESIYVFGKIKQFRMVKFGQVRKCILFIFQKYFYRKIYFYWNIRIVNRNFNFDRIDKIRLEILIFNWKIICMFELNFLQENKFLYGNYYFFMGNYF